MHLEASPKFKRSSTLALYWQSGMLVCANYRTRSRTTINSQGIELLDYFHEWRTPQECASHFSDYSPVSVLRGLEALEQRELLVREGSPAAQSDAACERAWGNWLPSAGLLHFGTKDVSYAEEAEEIDDIIGGLLQASPQPPFSKIHPGLPTVELPQPPTGQGGFLDVLLKRRTHRSFSPKDIRRDQLSALLYYTWGVTGFMEVPPLGRLPLKTSPSGGARHPEEVYVAALRVEGLTPGLYHYVSDRHCLECISVGLTKSRAIEYCTGQEWVGDAGALFIMSAVFARTMWKYPIPRSYRVVLAEAGHYCQTFCLVATSLGLAPFCTMALKDSLIETDLGLNGFEEGVLYVAGAGVLPAT
jgi:SagB-type dehydrogenase family enzyme